MQTKKSNSQGSKHKGKTINISKSEENIDAETLTA